MPRDGYLCYAPSIEQPRPDEPETIKTIVASIERTNASSFAARSHAIRQQHAKGQGFLKGELTVYDDLPDHLRQGMFATARSYPIIVRLSSIRKAQDGLSKQGRIRPCSKADLRLECHLILRLHSLGVVLWPSGSAIRQG